MDVCLVRTDPDAQHEGISFVVLPMDQPGVTVKPIKLISGSSPFCETFFDNAVAKRESHRRLNKGWTVGKRLLQYERNATTKAKPKKRLKRQSPRTTEIECLRRSQRNIQGKTRRAGLQTLRRETASSVK